MLAAIASFAFVGTAGGMGQGSNRNRDMEERKAYTSSSLKKSGGGDDHTGESEQRGTGRRQHDNG